MVALANWINELVSAIIIIKDLGTNKSRDGWKMSPSSVSSVQSNLVLKGLQLGPVKIRKIGSRIEDIVFFAEWDENYPSLIPHNTHHSFVP